MNNLMKTSARVYDVGDIKNLEINTHDTYTIQIKGLEWNGSEWKPYEPEVVDINFLLYVATGDGCGTYVTDGKVAC